MRRRSLYICYATIQTEEIRFTSIQNSAILTMTMVVNDENKPSNNLVAESDLKATLDGIDQCLQGWKQNAEENESINTLLESAQVSLKTHLQRLVVAVPDDDYYQHLRQNVTAEVEQDDMSDEEDDEPISDDEYDPEQLLDAEVFQRARILRQQVREASERVHRLRASVSERAISVAQREAALLVGACKSNQNDKPYNADAVAAAFRQPFDGHKSAKLMEMEESLQTLSTQLKEMDVKVPDTMEMLQETIDTISTALGATTLSQTERAIRSRSNEGPAMKPNLSIPVGSRLALFLGQH